MCQIFLHGQWLLATEVNLNLAKWLLLLFSEVCACRSNANSINKIRNIHHWAPKSHGDRIDRGYSNMRHAPCMLLGYTVGESRHTSGCPKRLEKFCRIKKTITFLQPVLLHPQAQFFHSTGLVDNWLNTFILLDVLHRNTTRDMCDWLANQQKYH